MYVEEGRKRFSQCVLNCNVKSYEQQVEKMLQLALQAHDTLHAP